MRKFSRFRASSSGQLLVVAALIIALLISSTTVYVYELGRETNGTSSVPMNDFVLSIEQSTRNAMISSLANVSNGGPRSVLTDDLGKLSQVLRSLSNFGTSNQSFAAFNGSNYDSGTWLSWNTGDMGVSSDYANFTLKVFGLETTVTVDYAINITTTATLNGSYTRIIGNEKLLNLTCKIFNEEQSALAKNIDLSYLDAGNWIPVNSSNNLSILDHGDGTYSIAFTVETTAGVIPVSANIHDLRGIFVQANTTCLEA